MPFRLLCIETHARAFLTPFILAIDRVIYLGEKRSTFSSQNEHSPLCGPRPPPPPHREKMHTQIQIPNACPVYQDLISRSLSKVCRKSLDKISILDFRHHFRPMIYGCQEFGMRLNDEHERKEFVPRSRANLLSSLLIRNIMSIILQGY